MARLRVDAALRLFCGCYSAGGLPHESKFSCAFAEFAATELPQQLRAAVIAATQSEPLLGHIARDSTPLPLMSVFRKPLLTRGRYTRKTPKK